MLTNIRQTAPFDPPVPSNLSFCGCSFDWRQSCAESFPQYGVQPPSQRSNWSRQRQAEYIAGRYCAIQALTAAAELNSPAGIQLPIANDRSPQWPPGTLGSISHSGDRAIAIAGRDRDFSGLGIDCEMLLKDSAAAEIAPWVLQRNDLDCRIEAPLTYGQWVTLVFSAKESLFKALAPSHKHFFDFGPLSNMFFVSKITAKTLILNTELRRARGSCSISQSNSQSNSQSRSQSRSQPRSQLRSQFELFYRVDDQQILTMALIAWQ